MNDWEIVDSFPGHSCCHGKRAKFQREADHAHAKPCQTENTLSMVKFKVIHKPFTVTVFATVTVIVTVSQAIHKPVIHKPFQLQY